MLESMARRIVKRRRAILIIGILLTLACATQMGRATINYDIASYLNPSTVTRRTLDTMRSEFGSIDQLTLMFSNLNDGEAEAISRELGAREGVMYASFQPDEDEKTLDGARYQRINLFIDAQDPVSFARALGAELDGGGREYWLSGASAGTIRTQKSIAAEIPIAMGVSVLVVLIVLFVSSHSYIEPLIFVIVLLMSIVVNMGTNWIFPSISFVTFAVSPILQLALAMDYSIMLLHSFFDFRDRGQDDETALVNALTNTFMPIASSSLTTIAGLSALMFMSFTIGFDIGIVLVKGIAISMISVFTMMPALIMGFGRLLRRTMHKTLPLGGRQIGAFANASRRVLPFALIAVILVCAYVQTKNEYVYMDPTASEQDELICRVFGRGNQLVLLLPGGETDEDYEIQRDLARRLTEIQSNGKPAVSNVTAMVTTGDAAIREYTANEVAELLNIPRVAANFYFGAMGFGTSARGDVLVSKAAELMPDNADVQELKKTLDFAQKMFRGKNYARMILRLDLPDAGEETYRVIDQIAACMDECYPGRENGMAGISMSSYEISEAFSVDLMRVSLITVAAIFLIVWISFRSLSVPTLLICVIQGAIWMAMSVSVLRGEKMFFMCYLICLAIQMGATIDYGILTTTSYRKARESLPPAQAIVSAMTLSMPTIFTSGLILTAASFLVGKVCTVYYIYSIGQILARGALISALLVLFLLPPMLVNLDRWIVRPGKRTTPEAPSDR